MVKTKLLQGDCLELMKDVPDKSIDMILCDLPYGTTECKWDMLIDLKLLWKEYERIIKDTGMIILFSGEPFTTTLINSNLKLFKYDWIWVKNNSTGFLNAKVRPMKKHENIIVFSKSPITSTSNNTTYNAQGLLETNKTKTNFSTESTGERKSRKTGTTYTQKFTNYPNSILNFNYDKQKLHPTQKPVALFEYLIKTYTNEGELVLDNCMGSGTTGVACVNLNRDFIGMELDEKYFEIAKERINKLNSLEVED